MILIEIDLFGTFALTAAAWVRGNNHSSAWLRLPTLGMRQYVDPSAQNIVHNVVHESVFDSGVNTVVLGDDRGDRGVGALS
ncbi:hypothetical protein WL88_26190 [Burkholderia diffusa]|uniref:Uncharacterized protein n=1 Tax=Burkholderia diffusa TaxID=488732 RepID=A0AAW3PA04_9BURK|nr:hypothetical protein WL86_30235 [Burkholderia diffusa]KWF38751.1 hypothetical protein WL85_11375 [Burkholderia diffusa]KWF46796.1 hypothetical protein WL88_26190 [Burkholderia diffusa]KWF50634.1 hypothetical protein WL87_15730 [Burkholderia diffusa]